MGSPASTIKKFLIGTLIGIASTLPGVSGATLAACFGIYERLIADLADIKNKIREEFYFILILGLGILFGAVAIFFGLDYIMEHYLVVSLLFFAGLILGQLPELWKFTEPSTKASMRDIASLIAGLAIMGIFLFLGTSNSDIPTHDPIAYVYMALIGVIYAISSLAPGISGSAILMALGMFTTLTYAITNLDVLFLIPAGIGLLLGLIGFAKIVNYALVNYRKPTYMLILGLSIGSIALILQEAVNGYNGLADLLMGAIALLVGVAASMLFSRIGRDSCEEFCVKPE